PRFRRRTGSGLSAGSDCDRFELNSDSCVEGSKSKYTKLQVSPQARIRPGRDFAWGRSLWPRIALSCATRPPMSARTMSAARQHQVVTMKIRYCNADGTPKYTNRLISETSPYLQKHAHNPVEWYPWGEEAFARDRIENKPIHL